MPGIDLSDVNQLREMAARLEELQQQGLNDAEIERQLEREQADQRRQLQTARGALNADTITPGQQPDQDPIEAAFAAGKNAGARGSQAAFKAFVDTTFAAAGRGDPRVTTQGTVDTETNERWLADAHERQTRNKERSSFVPR
jgi:hypothetical protein